MNTDTFCSDSFATKIRAKIGGKDVRLKVLSSLLSGGVMIKTANLKKEQWIDFVDDLGSRNPKCTKSTDSVSLK